jgi:type VI secretion system protein ImpL
VTGRRGGVIGGRWTVGAFAWAMLSAAAWFAGDALVVDGERPLEGALARLTFIVGVAVLWLGWELWRLRGSMRENERLLDGLVSGSANSDSTERAAQELSLLRKRFEDALRVLRKARFRSPDGERRTVAQLPWYMFIGAPGSGKTTALLNAGMRFPLGDPRGGETLQGVGGTRNCDWWFTDEAVLLDTAGRYTTQESDRDADAAAWLGFLDLLKTFRPRQPLNGVLVTVSLSDLAHWNNDELARYGAHVRERIGELHQRLGVRLPIYLVVTKVDLLAGFNEFFSEFDAERRAQVWGMTFGATELLAGGAITARFEDEFAGLERRLYAMLPGRLQKERDLQRRAAIYRFPQQFRLSGPLVAAFLRAGFASLWSGEAALVRGVYFTSGTQEGSPIDRVLGTLARSFNLERKVQPPAPGTGKSFFLRRLLREVIFVEASLAGVNAALERRRRRALNGAFIGLAALTFGLGGAWTLAYFNNRELVAATQANTAAARAQIQAQAALRPGDEARLLALLDRLLELRVRVDPAGMPVRVGLGQGEKLGTQAARAYRNALRDTLLPHAVLSLERTMRRAGASREAIEAYVSLYDAGRPDAAVMHAALMRIWKLPDTSRNSLDAHLRAALAARPLELPHRRDDALIEAARRRLDTHARL